MALEFSAAVKRIPVYPAASAYALPEDVALLASNESPEPPLPEVVAAVTSVLGGLNRYPDPTNAELRRALSDRTGVPAHRIAIGNGLFGLRRDATTGWRLFWWDFDRASARANASSRSR